jgi:hypothetical protein
MIKRALKAVEHGPKRIEFRSSGDGSNLGGLLSLAQSMPTLRYDSARLGHVGEFTADEKTHLARGLNNTTDALTRIIEQIGLLMASYDTTMGTIDAEKVVELGWTVNGIADVLLRLHEAREQIEDAEASHG